MITLIENGIEVQAETIAQAKRALAKAGKLARKQNEERSAHRRLAETKADANCYRFMNHIARDGNMPRGYKLYPLGYTYGSCSQLPEQDDEGRNQFKISSYSTDGPESAVAIFYPCDVVLGQICNSQGCIGLHVRWMDGNEQIIGVGMSGGEFSFSVAHGITADMFKSV